MEPYEVLDFILENVQYSLFIKSLITHGLLVLIFLLIVRVFISIKGLLNLYSNMIKLTKVIAIIIAVLKAIEPFIEFKGVDE